MNEREEALSKGDATLAAKVGPRRSSFTTSLSSLIATMLGQNMLSRARAVASSSKSLIADIRLQQYPSSSSQSRQAHLNVN